MNKQAKPSPTVRDPAKAMPAVSEEFITWLRGQMIPEIISFSSMDGDGALKQIGYSHGILYVKSLILQQHRLNQNTAGMKSVTVSTASNS